MTKKDIKATRARLRAMARSGGRHHLRNAGRILKYGIIGFGRNIWLSITSTLVMTFTLFVLFVTIIASMVLTSTATAMRAKIDITIFFKPSTSQSALESMKRTMSNDPNVKTVEIATSEEEYNKFIDETKKDDDQELLTALDDDAMRKLMIESMQSTMRIKVNNADDLTSIKEIVNHDPNFTKNLDDEKSPTYNTNDTAISTIVSWANIANTGGLILSGIFLIISILVIFNTIRMAIFSRSEEIYMEKLVGADNHFIRGPFRVEAMMSGVLAGLFAGTLGLIAFNILSPRLSSYDIDISNAEAILHSNWLVFVYLGMVALGCLISLLSSRFAVHRYLK